METPHTYESKEQFLNWLDRLPEEELEQVARRIIGEVKQEGLPETEAAKEAHEETVSKDNRAKKQSLISFLSESRAYVKNPEFEEINFEIQEF